MANVAPPGLATFTYPASVVINGTPTVVQLPAAGYRLFTYDAGTSTPRTTWSDSGETVPNTNPIILDANGQAQIFYRGNYRLELRQPVAIGGGVVWTVDNFNVPDPNAALSGVFANGSASTPSVRFSQAASSGLFSPAANVVALSQNGVELQRWTGGNGGFGGTVPLAKWHVFGTCRYDGNLTISSGGLTVTAGGATVTAGGVTISAGGATITGNSSVAGNLSVTAGTFTSRGFADNATAAAWNIDSAGRLRNNGNTQLGFSARTTGVAGAGTVLFGDVAFTGGYNRSFIYDTGTGIATVPTGQGGDYLIVFTASAVLNAAGAGLTAQLRVNGNSVIARSFGGNDVGGQSGVSIATCLTLAAGDQVSIFLASVSNSALQSNATFSMRQLG